MRCGCAAIFIHSLMSNLSLIVVLVNRLHRKSVDQDHRHFGTKRPGMKFTG
jgi:hypothetical protein